MVPCPYKGVIEVLGAVREDVGEGPDVALSRSGVVSGHLEDWSYDSRVGEEGQRVVPGLERRHPSAVEVVDAARSVFGCPPLALKCQR